jgi:adenosylhomocysteinase
MEGYQVMSLMEAAKIGDIFITVTGDKNVIDKKHMQVMKDGIIMANSGHFNSEINIPALEAMSAKKRTVRPFVEEYTLADGRQLYLLGEGRLINLAAAEGHPASVMDMSFANQALCMEYGQTPRQAGNKGARRAGGDRSGGSTPEAEGYGREDRQTDPRAAQIPVELGRRNVTNIASPFEGEAR